MKIPTPLVCGSPGGCTTQSMKIMMQPTMPTADGHTARAQRENFSEPNSRGDSTHLPAGLNPPAPLRRADIFAIGITSFFFGGGLAALIFV